MDAPAAQGQHVEPFVHIAEHLTHHGFSAPEIIAEDRENGFLLLEDLGDAVFAHVIDEDPNKELMLYRAALDVALKIERLKPPAGVPEFTARLMAEMIEPAFTWYRWAMVGNDGEPDDLRDAMRHALTQIEGQSFSLRDFHAENLIWLPERAGPRRVGLLDFQDAMIGPRGYDLVSLLYDARRDVSQPVIETIQAEYAQSSGLNLDQVQRDWAVLTLQRNLRILGIFVRLALKFGKPRYLDFLPRVWRYVEQSATRPGLNGLGEAVLEMLPPPTRGVMKELRGRCGSVPNR